jgi:hypothetical protein
MLIDAYSPVANETDEEQLISVTNGLFSLVLDELSDEIMLQKCLKISKT